MCFCNNVGCSCFSYTRRSTEEDRSKAGYTVIVFASYESSSAMALPANYRMVSDTYVNIRDMLRCTSFQATRTNALPIPCFP